MILTILELQNQGKLQECSQYAPHATRVSSRFGMRSVAAR